MSCNDLVRLMYRRDMIITRGCPHGRIAEAVRPRFNITVPPERRIGLIIADNAPFDPYLKKFRGEKETAMCPTLMFDGIRAEGLDGREDYLLFLRVLDAELERLKEELGGII